MVKSSKLMLMSLCLLALFGTSCKMGAKKPTQEKLYLVNVLDKKFFDDCYLAGSANVEAVNIGMDDIEAYAQKNWDDMSHIVVYCANYKCTASGESAKMLKDQGFKNVWAYEGGAAEWKQLGYPVKGACKEAFLNDYEKPEGHQDDPEVPVITAQELKSKIEEFSSKE